MKQLFSDEFETDWCYIGLNHVLKNLKMLSGSKWLLFSQEADSVFCALVRFLQFISYDQKLNLTIQIVTGEETRKEIADLPSISINALKEGVTADFCVFCGYTAKSERFHSQEQYQVAMRNAERFWQHAKALRRRICISSSRVYGFYPCPVMASEMEFQNGGGDFSCKYMRNVERLSSEGSGSYVILRPDTLLSHKLNIQSPVAVFLQNLERDAALPPTNAGVRYSLVSFGDFLGAFLLAALTKQDNCAYNVSSEENTVSLLSVYDLFYEISGKYKDCQLQLCPAKGSSNHGLNGAKIRALDWKPTLNLRTMLLLELLSYQEVAPLVPSFYAHPGKLPQIHICLLKILQEIDRICRRHNIQYFLAGGTLLGAVRHQGFIPWDDDMDIMMRREEYERFLAVANEELSPELFLQTPKTEKGNHYLISKIRLKGTVMSSEFLARFPELQNGIFVDIIAQDYTANSLLGQRIHQKLTLLARGLVFKKWSKVMAATIKKQYIVFDAVIKLFPISWLEAFQHQILTLFRKLPNRKFLYDGMGMNLTRGAYPAQWLSDCIYINFEGKPYPIPVDWEAYLRYLYGDYRKLPPLHQRFSCHHFAQIDLGEYMQASESYV